MPEIEEVSTPGAAASTGDEEEKLEPGSEADLERFFKKVNCTKDEALTEKHLKWGWKNLDKDDGAALAYVIRNNATCITFDLFVNEIFEAGVLVCAALKDNAKLKSLDLQQGQIGVEGARALAESLRTNVTLMNLKLHYNCLGPEGTKLIADALKVNKKLTNLDLGDNGIGMEGCKALANMLGTNKELARLDVSKNANVQGNDAAKAVLQKAADKRKPTEKYGKFTLIVKDEPGQKWSPEGFHDVVKWC